MQRDDRPQSQAAGQAAMQDIEIGVFTGLLSVGIPFPEERLLMRRVDELHLRSVRRRKNVESNIQVRRANHWSPPCFNPDEADDSPCAVSQAEHQPAARKVSSIYIPATYIECRPVEPRLGGRYLLHSDATRFCLFVCGGRLSESTNVIVGCRIDLPTY